MFIYLFCAVALTLLYKIGSLIIRKRYKEPSFVGFRVRRPVEALKVLKIVAFFAFLGTLLWFSLVYGATSFTDNFDDYPLGALAGNDDWTGGGYVVNDEAQSGSNSAFFSTTYGEKTLDATTTDDYFSFYSYIGTGSYTFVRFLNGTAPIYPFISIDNNYGGSGRVGIYHYSGAAYTLIAPVVADNWYFIEVEWRSTPTRDFRFQVDSGGWTAWISSDITANGLNIVSLAGSHITAPNYFDTFLGEAPLPEFRIWGIAPASSTEIVATSTEFTFGYEGFATTSWSGILVNFCEETTGICADEKKYPKADLSGTSGQKTLSFDNFNFDANGHYDLIGDAYFGSFNYNWEWVEGYTGDVVSPDYYVMINFEGLPEIFQVEVPATWYTEHTEYATSTAFFSTISDILTPLFSKIGEFGSRISGFFNQDEAYSRGKNIGAILPTFKLYIAQFSFLFGGFPIIETFILAMVVMVGFFLFKLVFRLVRG